MAWWLAPASCQLRNSNRRNLPDASYFEPFIPHLPTQHKRKPSRMGEKRGVAFTGKAGVSQPKLASQGNSDEVVTSRPGKTVPGHDDSNMLTGKRYFSYYTSVYIKYICVYVV